MEMSSRSLLCALAVVVLTGSMAVAALADDYGMNAYGPADSSVSSQPEQNVEQTAAGEIREPVETGAVPDRPESSSALNCCTDSGESPVEIGGRMFRPGIDLGP